jgi:hypothetical protein
MKNSLLFLVISSSLIIFIACQPKAIIKNDDTAMIDSSFYYVQQDINDPFLDTVFQDPDKPIQLEKTIYPPPVQAPKFKEIEGFRVQIFAGVDSLNALTARAQALEIVTDSVYLFSDKGLIKIQVGDYPYRFSADNARDKFKNNGFTGAWVIQRQILIPMEAAAEPDSLLPAITAQPSTSDAPEKEKYKIQVLATASEERVTEIVTDIKQNLGFNTFSEKSGNLFKVFVGYFKEETEARNVLEKVRKNGYPDAWLVY